MSSIQSRRSARRSPWRSVWAWRWAVAPQSRPAGERAAIASWCRRRGINSYLAPSLSAPFKPLKRY